MNHRATLNCIHLVKGVAGKYEPDRWTVNAWTTRELAEAEAARLTELAKGMWAELKAFENGYKDDMNDEEAGAYFDARQVVCDRWEQLSGDTKISYYEESEYYVTEVPLKA